MVKKQNAPGASRGANNANEGTTSAKRSAASPESKASARLSKELRERGIALDAAKWARLSIASAEEIKKQTGRSDIPCDGIAIPYFDLKGNAITVTRSDGLKQPFVRFRLLGHFQPKNAKKPIKYVQSEGTGNHLYVPQAPLLDWSQAAKDTNREVFYVEGEFKAIALAALGRCALGIGGVSNWRKRGDDGESAPIPDLDWIDYHNRKTYIAFDSDAATNPNVAAAREKFGQELYGRHAIPLYLDVPRINGDDKTGVDDWIKARGARADKDFTDLANAARSPFVLRTHDATELINAKIEHIPFLAEGILPAAGLVCLAGFQKRGKSWWALQLAIAVACGETAMGRWKIRKPLPVLYIAFEDNRTRMQMRLQMLGFPADAPRNLKIVYAKDIQTGARAYEQIRRWIVDNAPKGGLVIADTFQRLRGAKVTKASSDAYQQDVSELSPLQEMAMSLGVCFLFTHHLTKKKGTDPFSQVSGSIGITATCDAILVLERKSMSPTGFLHAQVRDAPDDSIALTFNEGVWAFKGDATEVPRTGLQEKIMNALKGSEGPMLSSAIADAIGKSRESVSRALGEMVDERRVMRLKDGSYSLKKGGSKF